MTAVELGSYVFETLMPDLVGHDHRSAAFLVYLLLSWRTQDSDDGWKEISLREMAEGTGLSKRAVQSAIDHLVRRKLLRVRRAGITALGAYRVERPWRGRPGG